MKAYAELTDQEKKAEVTRWSAVLPAAVLGSIVASLVAGGVVGLASLGQSVSILIVEFAKGGAFVVAGALCAPRRRLATAIGLAALWVLLSVTIHILVVENRGSSNYMAVAGATLAAVAAVIYFFARRPSTSIGKVGEP